MSTITPQLLPLLFSLCVPFSQSQIAFPASITNFNDEQVCERKIKYEIHKLAYLKEGKEVNINAEMTVDPASKVIHIKAEGKKFDMHLESLHCSLTENMETGQAIYTGYVIQPSGKKSRSILSIEMKDGTLHIAGSPDGRPANYIMVVRKWEKAN